MEVFVALENKVKKLLNFLQTLNEQNSTLKIENALLKNKIDEFQNNDSQRIVKDNEIIKEWKQGRDTTAAVIDDLIENIDLFIENGNSEK